jgi:hypothetical protein
MYMDGRSHAGPPTARDSLVPAQERGHDLAPQDGFELLDTSQTVRCGTELELDPDRPYCDSHSAVWARYSNPDYAERDCYHEHKDRFGM